MLLKDSAVRRWAVGGLVCYGIAVAIILFSPVSYGGIISGISDWLARVLGASWFGSGWIEFSANVLMFAPLGLLIVLLFGRLRIGVLTAAIVSAGAELIQFVIPSRDPTLRDVVANTLGALLGAAVARLFFSRRLSRGAGSSEHPLDQTLAESDGIVHADPAVEHRDE